MRGPFSTPITPLTGSLFHADPQVDLRNAVLQNKEIYEKMQAFAASATSRRIALVASAPLARMQSKRLQVRENIVLFAELADAEAWLFQGDHMAAA